MRPPDTHSSGWRAVILIAVTYIYFLIFAQFAFLKRLAELGIADVHLKAVMGAMGAGGILLSLLTPRIRFWPSPRLRMRVGLGACAAASALSLLPLGLYAGIGVACLIGCGLGLLTVTLVTHLRSWLGDGTPLLKVGVGTGFGYLVCNFPPFFTASPEFQAATSSILCVGCLAVPLRNESPADQEQITHASSISFLRVLICFTALVWFDSAAFFIIQNTPALKAGTWQGSIHLWSNGLLHLFAALASAFLLRRSGLTFVLSAAFLGLASACLLLLDPSHALAASVLYPVGVSLYSVALVAYPSLLTPAASLAERGRQAGWLYAIAGWFGSAMGIGMSQHLGHVPPAFVACAGALVFASPILGLIGRRRRELIAACGVLIVAFGVDRAVIAHHPPLPQLSAMERGRQVYISEGCIHCHSQYVRPGTRDVLMWGPIQTVDQLRQQHPPLIGNRRQGPDLSQVGGRRSPLWLRAHFYDPRELSHDSFMPSYGYLFRGSTRGDDLIAYLSSLKTPEYTQHISAEQGWCPTNESAHVQEGSQLFHAYCGTCHEADGRIRNQWRASFTRLPPDLQTGPWLHLPLTDSHAQRELRLARIIKFGIPGTDMPGHEYLSDRDISSLALWLNGQIADTRQSSGENQ
jgi:cbb3-type cytochrome oxidase cytochrome c subunit